DNMPQQTEDKGRAYALFNKICSLSEKNNYHDAIHLIEKEQDFLGTMLNMGDQQKLSKLYAHCAYKEIERIYLDKPSSSQMKELIAKYSHMLEVHLSPEEKKGYDEISSKFDVSKSVINPSKKRFHNLRSPRSYSKESSVGMVLPTVVFILFIAVLGVVVFPYLQSKFGSEKESTPTEQVPIEQTSPDETEPVESPVPTEPSTETPVTSGSAASVQDEISSYLLPSDTSLLTREDVAGFSKDQVSLAINEMFARHGYSFDGSGLYYEYFMKKSWYKPDPSIKQPIEAEKKFNEIERKNLKFLADLRKSL
ncbi:MAG: YARHG domain-containing protein, partial [Filifactor alocis]|nr:YARHG domain-containing protein [Filifactor alocis]